MKNEKYFISVAEPWDFESPDGQNKVRGSIVSVKSNQCLVFKSNYDLKFGDVTGDILVLFPRHYGIDFSDLGDKRLAFNGGLLLKKYNENLSEKELEENSKFVIIGSFRKE
ncbi:hypothetical protein AGMMS50262_23640 [Bacteroidia bacterium]|nr:hypothetical protein AGMMS50262_23640 [Bacteroidia bacterium]